MVDNAVNIKVQVELDERQAKRVINRGIKSIEDDLPTIDLGRVFDAGSLTIANLLASGIATLTDSLEDLGRTSIQAAARLEQLGTQLSFLGIVNVDAEIERIAASARTLNVTTLDAADAFTKLRTAFQGTNQEARALTIFEDLSIGFKVLGADADEIDRAFRALSQTFAKGAFSAEEVRGQLLEAIPPAVPFLAQAAGLSIQELNEALSENAAAIGDVNTVIPRFAELLGDAGRALNILAKTETEAQLGQLQSQITDLQIQIGLAIKPILSLSNALAKLAFPEIARGVQFLSENLEGLVAVLAAISVSKGLVALSAGGSLVAGLGAIAVAGASVAGILIAIAAAARTVEAAFVFFGAVSTDVENIRGLAEDLRNELSAIEGAAIPAAGALKEVVGSTGDFSRDFENAQAAIRSVNDSLRTQLDLQVKNNQILQANATLWRLLGNLLKGLFVGTDVQQQVNDFNALRETIDNLTNSASLIRQSLDTESLAEFAAEADKVKSEIEDVEAKLASLRQEGDTSSTEFVDLTKRLSELRTELGGLPRQVLGVDIDQAKEGLAIAEAQIRLLEQRGNLTKEEQTLLENLRSIQASLTQDVSLLREIQSQVTVETKATSAATEDVKDVTQEINDLKAIQRELDRQAAEAARLAAQAERERLEAIRESFSLRQEQARVEAEAVNQQQQGARTLAAAEQDNVRVTAELLQIEAQLRGVKIDQNAETRIAAALKQQELAIALQLAQAEAQRAEITAQLAVNEAQLEVEKQKQLGADQAIIALAEQRVALSEQQLRQTKALGALEVDTAQKQIELEKRRAELADRQRQEATRSAEEEANNIVPTTRAGGIGRGITRVGVGGGGLVSTGQEAAGEQVGAIDAQTEAVVTAIENLTGVVQEELGTALQPGSLRDQESFQGTDFDEFLNRFPSLERRGLGIPGTLQAPPPTIELPDTGRRGSVVAPGGTPIGIRGQETTINAPITVNLSVNGDSRSGGVQSAAREAAVILAQELRQLSQ